MSHRPTSPASSPLDRRQTAILALGNALEVYDFLLYGFLAPVIAQQFFPAADPLSSLLMAFMVFGAGFIMRPLGAVVVLLLSQLLPAAAYASWGWRLAFALGLLVVPVAWLMRRQLAAGYVSAPPSGPGLWPAQRQRLIWSTLLITGSTAGVYLLLTFLPAYLSEQRAWPKAVGQLAALAAGITIMLASPWFGRLADRLSEPARLVRPALACAMLLVPLLFWFVQQDQLRWLLVPLVVLYMLATVAMTVSGLTLLIQGFAPAHRTLATGIVYSVGVTLFGGFSGATVLKLLAWTGSAWMPALYLLLALATSWLALSRLQRLAA